MIYQLAMRLIAKGYSRAEQHVQESHSLSWWQTCAMGQTCGELLESAGLRSALKLEPTRVQYQLPQKHTKWVCWSYFVLNHPIWRQII